MKQLLLLNILLVSLLSTQAQSAPVMVFADNVKTTVGGFSATPGGPVISNDIDIQSIIASNPATAIYGSDSATYSTIDLDFGGVTASTGAGADLVIYSSWKGFNYSFGLEAFGADPSNPLSSFNYSVAECTANQIAANICTADISATSIDLFAGGLALDNDITLSYIRLFIGGSKYNGDVIVGGLDAYSNFSLVGSLYNNATVVPLPLSAILFSSGLALIGWAGRKKTL